MPTRREMMLAGLGLLLTGCSQSAPPLTRRPQTPWPGDVSRPTDSSQTTVYRPAPTPAPRPQPQPTTHASANSLGAISRSRWSIAAPVSSRVNPMSSINRITVHHEGWEPFWNTDEAGTIQRLRQIHTAHVDVRGWGDIGYHYVIDRAGRVWEARDIRHQGAHVRGENEGNVGIMLLGNFDRQSPTDVQVQQMVRSLQILMRQHNVSVHRVLTHQELNPTACPGRTLQAKTNAIRSGRTLA